MPEGDFIKQLVDFLVAGGEMPEGLKAVFSASAGPSVTSPWWSESLGESMTRARMNLGGPPGRLRMGVVTPDEWGTMQQAARYGNVLRGHTAGALPGAEMRAGVNPMLESIELTQEGANALMRTTALPGVTADLPMLFAYMAQAALTEEQRAQYLAAAQFEFPLQRLLRQYGEWATDTSEPYSGLRPEELDLFYEPPEDEVGTDWLGTPVLPFSPRYRRSSYTPTGMRRFASRYMAPITKAATALAPITTAATALVPTVTSPVRRTQGPSTAQKILRKPATVSTSGLSRLRELSRAKPKTAAPTPRSVRRPGIAF